MSNKVLVSPFLLTLLFERMTRMVAKRALKIIKYSIWNTVVTKLHLFRQSD